MKRKVDIQPKIGPFVDALQAVVSILNVNLADEAVLSVKTRCALWNARGAGFFNRRTLFEAQYKLLNEISDEISNRVRVLGGSPIGSYAEFLKHSRLDEKPGEVAGKAALLADHEAAIRFLHEDARRCSLDYADEGTYELLLKGLRLHEKMAWMLRSSIEPELPGKAS